MRFQTLPERNCVTRLKLDPRRMARPASVISPQWSNPIVTRGLANLLLSCEMRSRHEASMPARPPLSLRKGENGNPPHTDVQDALSSPPTFSFEAYFFLSSSSKTKRGLVYQLNRLNDELRRESFRKSRNTLRDFPFLPIFK